MPAAPPAAPPTQRPGPSRPQQQAQPHAQQKTQQAPRTQIITRVADEALAAIDQVADSCRLTLAEQAGSMTHAITVARGMTQLRELINTQVMAEILPLMNSELGFDTDHNPAKPGKDGPPIPYSEEIVKEAFIVATLRGARPVGNEFNIIARRAYLTKNCFRRLVREFPGLRNLKTWYGVPKGAQGSGGAVVPCKAWWDLNTQPQSIDVEIPVRLNAGMGADAAIGKAERKLLARIYSQLTGSMQEEAEVDVDTAPAGEGSQVIDATATQVQQAAVQTAVDAETAHAAAEASQVVPEQPTEREPGAKDDKEDDPDAAASNEAAGHLLECLLHTASQYEVADVAKSIDEAAAKGAIGPNQHAQLRAAVMRRRNDMSAAAGFPVDDKPPGDQATVGTKAGAK